MKPNTMHLLFTTLLLRCALIAGIFVIHRSREAKISRGAACVPNTTLGALLAQSRQRCTLACIKETFRRFQCPKVRLSHSKEVHLHVRHVCMMFRNPKPCTRLGKILPPGYMHRSNSRLQSGSMASEVEYSDMWIDMWKDGIAPGQASSTIVTAFRTKARDESCSCLLVQCQGLLAEI